MGPEKDSNKDSEKLSETMSSMSGATSTRDKALKIEVEKQSGSSDSLLKNDFAKKPLQHKENSGTDVKLDATSEFAGEKAWKPVLKTDEIEKNRGMGMPTPTLLPFLLVQLPPSPLFLTSMLGLNQWSLNI